MDGENKLERIKIEKMKKEKKEGIKSVIKYKI